MTSSLGPTAFESLALAFAVFHEGNRQPLFQWTLLSTNYICLITLQRAGHTLEAKTFPLSLLLFLFFTREYPRPPRSPFAVAILSRGSSEPTCSFATSSLNVRSLLSYYFYFAHSLIIHPPLASEPSGEGPN